MGLPAHLGRQSLDEDSRRMAQWGAIADRSTVDARVRHRGSLGAINRRLAAVALETMHPAEFDKLVEQSYARIPSRFRKRMQNIAIIVEAEPSVRQLRSARVPHSSTLLGLYEGRPLIHRSVSEPFAMPDRITIFQ